MTLIDKMEDIAKNDTVNLNKYISYQKERNKRKKVQVQIEKSIKSKHFIFNKIVDIIKKEKAEERMNKIVIKGRIQTKHDIIMHVKHLNVNHDKNKNDDNENNILYNINEHD